jgi:hypothetical protein
VLTPEEIEANLWPDDIAPDPGALRHHQKAANRAWEAGAAIVTHRGQEPASVSEMKALSRFRGFWRNLPLASKFASAALLWVLIVLVLTAVTIWRENRNVQIVAGERATLLAHTLSGRLRNHLYNSEADCGSGHR